MFSSPDIIRIPVHFFSSKQPQTVQKPSSGSNQSSALKIQTVFRGFLIRKSLNKISMIRNQVREIEQSIKDAETVELILKDEKERLRLNETLMFLLFELDSIRGVENGVREYRKSVIRDAIALQEKIDSVVGVVMIRFNDEIAREISTQQVANGCINSATDTDSVIDVHGVYDETADVAKEIDVDCNPESRGEEVEDRKRSVQLVEKLMDDNEKMTILMTQMFERNEMQTRMLNTLSRRVEKLEKKFKYRKKKRRLYA